VQMTGEADHREEDIAQLIFAPAEVAGEHLRGEFLQLFADFPQHPVDIAPIEANSGGPLLYLLGAHQCGQRRWNIGEQTAPPLAGSLLMFFLLPNSMYFSSFQLLIRVPPTVQGSIREYMGMTGYQLAGENVDNVGKIEVSALAAQLGMENHLKKQVPQFFRQMLGVVALDGIHHLIRLFQGKRRQADGILLTVPGATR